AMAVNPITNKIYVANFGSYNVTVIAEQQVQPIPLEADIAPLPNNLTSTLTPTFSFTASSSFSPYASDPDNLLLQLDTWQGPWTAATNLGSGGFSDQTAALQPGTHILYAYATDGQEATSTNTGFQSSPLIGNIEAYLFVVSPPNATLSPNPLGFGNQGIDTTSGSKAVTLTNNFSGPLAIASIAARGDYNATWPCLSALAPGASCTIEVTFTPTILGADNGPLTETDDNVGVDGTLQAVSLTGTGIAVTTLSLTPTSLTFPARPVGIPSA